MDSKKVLIGFGLGTLLGFLAIVISWLLAAESSPFYGYFLYNVGLKNLWMLFNFPAGMALILTGARSFEAGLFMIFFQWFLIGIFLVWISFRMMGGNRNKGTHSRRQ